MKSMGRKCHYEFKEPEKKGSKKRGATALGWGFGEVNLGRRGVSGRGAGKRREIDRIIDLRALEGSEERRRTVNNDQRERGGRKSIRQDNGGKRRSNQSRKKKQGSRRAKKK